MIGDDPNLLVEGVPPAIRAKVTELIIAAKSASADAVMDSFVAEMERQSLEVARYNLERTIMTKLKEKTK